MIADSLWGKLKSLGNFLHEIRIMMEYKIPVWENRKIIFLRNFWGTKAWSNLLGYWNLRHNSQLSIFIESDSSETHVNHENQLYNNLLCRDDRNKHHLKRFKFTLCNYFLRDKITLHCEERSHFIQLWSSKINNH